MTDILDTNVDIEPNVLSFNKIEPGAPTETFLYFWVLKDPEGKVIADSTFFFESRELAMENCIEIFGQSLALGRHIVKGEDDEKLLSKALEG